MVSFRRRRRHAEGVGKHRGPGELSLMDKGSGSLWCRWLNPCPRCEWPRRPGCSGKGCKGVQVTRSPHSKPTLHFGPNLRTAGPLLMRVQYQGGEQHDRIHRCHAKYSRQTVSLFHNVGRGSRYEVQGRQGDPRGGDHPSVLKMVPHKPRMK